MKTLQLVVQLVLHHGVMFGCVIHAPMDKAGLVGSDIKMDCHINDTGECEILWFRHSNSDSGEIQISRREKILNDMSKKMPGKYAISYREPYSLIIKNLTYNDSGKYRCHNTMDGKTIGGGAVQLVVLDRLKCPPAELYAYEGDTIMSECSLSHSVNTDIGKIPHIVWTRDNEPLHVSEIKTGPNISTSRINTTADVSMNGRNLVCMYKYMNVDDHCMSKLHVLFAARPPRLTFGSRDFTNQVMELEKGVHVTILCSTIANPPANYSWYFKPVDYKKPKYAVSFQNSLELATFQNDLVGEYICEVRNQFNGKVSQKASVTIQLKQDSPENYSQLWILAAGLGVLLALIVILIGFIVYVLRRIKRTIPVRGHQNREHQEQDETLTPLSESCLNDHLLEVNYPDRNRNHSDTMTSQSSTVISRNSTVSSHEGGKLPPFSDKKTLPKTRYHSSSPDDGVTTPESQRVMTSLNTGEMTPLNEDNIISNTDSPLTAYNKRACRRCGGTPKPVVVVTLNNEEATQQSMISRL